VQFVNGYRYRRFVGIHPQSSRRRTSRCPVRTERAWAVDCLGGDDAEGFEAVNVPSWTATDSTTAMASFRTNGLDESRNSIWCALGDAEDTVRCVLDPAGEVAASPVRRRTGGTPRPGRPRLRAAKRRARASLSDAVGANRLSSAQTACTTDRAAPSHRAHAGRQRLLCSVYGES